MMTTHHLDHDPEHRARAIRALLAQPLLLRRARDDDMFRAIATQRTFLTKWFDDHLGWQLHIDLRAGIARLHKRSRTPDARRGLRRQRAGKRGFDAFRYQLLALSCAEMLRRPHTTMGDLADAIARSCGADAGLRDFDCTRYADRVAFVDVLLWLLDVGALEVTAGEIEGFGNSSDSDAVLRANTTLIPLLLSSDVPPSRISADSPAQWVEQLTAEPRYGAAPGDPGQTDRELRARWSRHQLLRRLLDDPAVDLEDLHPSVRDYLFTPAGRNMAIKAAQDAGMVVERHADVWLAIDASGEASAATFASAGRASTTQQAAAMLLRALIDTDEHGNRRAIPRQVAALEKVLRDYLERHPAWARGARDGRGVEVLSAEAIELLEEFGLARRIGDEIVPRPAAARFVVHIQAISRETDAEELLP